MIDNKVNFKGIVQCGKGHWGISSVQNEVLVTILVVYIIGTYLSVELETLSITTYRSYAQGE